ncbi:hypothetical protein AGMMS49938_15780 [Fibrobacterales bacterium]|nr:hypothetical protein AGMMS49938_15780 [Fibrobacterales bacterium]
MQSFYEKPADSAWISGGFFVMQPEVFGYLNDDENTALESDPLEAVAKDGELGAYKHTEFWQAMDTLKDKMHLTDLWMTGKAPWAM